MPTPAASGRGVVALGSAAPRCAAQDQPEGRTDDGERARVRSARGDVPALKPVRMATLTPPLILRVHAADNVGVATKSLEAGVRVDLGEAHIVVTEEIPAGHKVALLPIPVGGLVRKYGFPIGEASQAVASGGWVHTHNLHTRLA